MDDERKPIIDGYSEHLKSAEPSLYKQLFRVKGKNFHPGAWITVFTSESYEEAETFCKEYTGKSLELKIERYFVRK